MSPDDKPDDSAARKAQADAIRSARDRRNERLNAPATPQSPGGSTAEDAVEPPSPEGDREPNYVEFIDGKMREHKKPDQ
jgi:hypothetical protein